jgi:RNA polymerase sigma-70 factor, ECF subfamily
MEAFLNGDPRAFEALFRQLSPRVVSVLARMTGDLQEAQDLAQVVFMKLFRARAAYRQGTRVAPWVFSIARNTFADERRRQRRRPQSVRAGDVLGEPPCEPPSAFEQRTLSELLQALPGSQRDALVMVRIQGLSIAEAAARSRTSPASIEMRVGRAYRSLRDRWPRA